MENKYYSFASIGFDISSEIPVADGKYFPAFASGNDGADYYVNIREGKLPEKTGEALLQCKNTSLYELNGKKLLFSSYQRAARTEKVDYACLERNGAELELTVLPGVDMRDTVLFRAINVPELMLERGAALVHASFVIINGEAILFTGKSGAGKSTQAHLWENVLGAEVVNGDRAAIREEDGRLFAYGVPFCGSSEIALNRKAPVRAIILLSQGKENIAARLSPAQGFAAVLSGTSYEPRNAVEAEAAAEIAQRAVQLAPIYSFCCTKDETAVFELQRILSYE